MRSGIPSISVQPVAGRDVRDLRRRTFGTGQIGDVRVGGNATNFTTLAEEYAMTTTPVEGALDAKISNFFIGGETNNVMLIAPSGSRTSRSAWAWTT